MSADAASAEARSSSRTSLSASSIASARPVSATARRYAAVVTQKPGGTGSPTEISSPRLAPFPPPRSRSFRRSVSSGTTSLCGGASKRVSTSGFSVSSCSPRSYISVGSVPMGVASVPGSFSPQAAVYQRETTANRAGLLIQFPLPNPRVRLRAFEKNSTGSRQELRPPVHDERYGVPDMDVYIGRFEGRNMVGLGLGPSRTHAAASTAFEAALKGHGRSQQIGGGAKYDLLA